MAAVAQAASAGTAYDELARLYEHPRTLSRSAVPICFDHGCTAVRPVAIDDGQWRQLVSELTPPSPDAATERHRIRGAIARFEQIVGRLAGTAGDRAGNLAGLASPGGQMDCVDESSNTTTYLTLLEQHGLLRWHRVEARVRRGYLLFGGWPHYAALIVDHQSGRRWVVDSWFHDNGQPPEVIELGAWEAGWTPQRHKTAAD